MTARLGVTTVGTHRLRVRLGVLSAASLLLAGAAAQAPKIAPVHGAPGQFHWRDLKEFGGSEAIIYRSADGRRVAAAFHESGDASFTYPFDEFLVVTSGSAIVAVHGGDTFTLNRGDVAYFLEGTRVDFKFSKDFSDITALTADHEVRWR